MERRLDLEFLPPEIMEQVASYLSVQDIIACSATSSTMRQILNDDIIWKKHCDLDTVDYLKQSNCLVEPSFKLDEDKESTLLPLCTWRKYYMMQVHVLKNIRHGRYKKKEIMVEVQDTIYYETTPMFYKNNYIFTHHIHYNNLSMSKQVWNVEETPSLLSESSFDFDRLMNSEFHEPVDINLYKIVKDKLVIAIFNVVLVFNISVTNQPFIPLDYAFVFDQSEIFSRSVFFFDKNTFCQKNYFEVHDQVETTVTGNYFTGALLSDEPFTDPTLHIWDIQTGRKIMEARIPINGPVITGLTLISSKEQKDLIVKLCVSRDRYSYHYYGYDLSKLEYSSFSVKLNYCDFIVFACSRVVGVGPRKIFIYDYNTSGKSLVRICNHEILKKTLTVLGNNLLFGTFDSTIQVMNLVTLDVINTFRLGFTLYSLHPICDKFVVINIANSEVWEIGKSARKLFKLPNHGSFVAANQHCTKFAIASENKIIILNFW